MSDVFSRLFNESVARTNDDRSKKLRDSVRLQEDEKWKLKLAASCYLVDKNTPSSLMPHEREVMSSLSAVSLHHKKSTRKSQKPKAQTILSQNRRCVSTIMDNCGNVTRTDNYIITDSVEPQPYRYLKPSPNSSRRFYSNKKSPRTKKVNTEEIKKELEENKIERAQWGRLDSICTTKIEVENAEEMQKRSNDDNIMVDMDNELPLDKLPKATNLISNTGICYEMYGYPDSLSFILDPK